MPRTSSPRLVQLLSPLRDFLRTEAAGGALLVVATAAALVWANSPWSESYVRLWESELSITLAGHTLALDLRHWVNDGLMAIFFLVVGLEIKRELTSGHLAGRRAAALPVAAAIGGMAVPAMIYLLIAGGSDARGWGVPMATDIALAIGLVVLLGSRVPSPLRSFLLGLAIVDDIGAILVIALVYSEGIGVSWLVAAAVALAIVVVLRAARVHFTIVYIAIGAGLWLALYEAGIHPTLAGVMMGLLAPTTPRLDPELVDADELADISTVESARATTEIARSSVSVVEWLEHVLHPWSSYLVVPLFALANAGVVISIDTLSDALGSAVAWGVFAGLVLGKPLGVLVASLAAARSGVAELPRGTRMRQLLGIGQAAGIGFTVALFISELAFESPARQAEAKLAILAASLVSALVAAAVLLTVDQDSAEDSERSNARLFMQ